MFNFGSIFEIPENSSVAKGEIGENMIKDVLINQKGFYSFHNVRVYNQQIDHIVVCAKGVFTIETKNFNDCEIYGSFQNEKLSRVSQYMRGYKTYFNKILFYNPIKQAEKHSEKLSQYINTKLRDVKRIKTIVVFANRTAKLKVFSPITPLIYQDELQNYFSSLKDVYKIRQCEMIASAIQQLIMNPQNKDVTKYNIPIFVKSV